MIEPTRRHRLIQVPDEFGINSHREVRARATMCPGCCRWTPHPGIGRIRSRSTEKIRQSILEEVVRQWLLFRHGGACCDGIGVVVLCRLTLITGCYPAASCHRLHVSRVPVSQGLIQERRTVDDVSRVIKSYSSTDMGNPIPTSISTPRAIKIALAAKATTVLSSS